MGTHPSSQPGCKKKQIVIGLFTFATGLFVSTANTKSEERKKINAWKKHYQQNRRLYRLQ